MTKHPLEAMRVPFVGGDLEIVMRRAGGSVFADDHGNGDDSLTAYFLGSEHVPGASALADLSRERSFRTLEHLSKFLGLRRQTGRVEFARQAQDLPMVGGTRLAEQK
jgi:hypothetical protein